MGLGEGGVFIVEGDFQHPPDPGKPGTFSATYRLFFADGTFDEGTFNVVEILIGL